MYSDINIEKVVGHINGENLETITFIADQQRKNGEIQKIALGEMYIATDPYTKERFLLRVTNIIYGQNPLYRTESARAYNQLISESFEGEHLNFTEIYQDERPGQRFIQAECEYIGCVDKDNHFGAPKYLPSDNSPVRKLNESDLIFMKSFLGNVPFGKVRSGSEVLNIPVGLFTSLIPYHIGVFAKTGSGKSNVIQRLVAGFLDKPGSAGMLLLDPHGEYKQNLVLHPHAHNDLEVFEMKSANYRKLRISYSDLSVNDIMVMRKKLQFSEPQERFMYDLEDKYGKEWFRKIIELPVNREELPIDDRESNDVKFLSEEFKGKVFEETIKVTKGKLMRIMKAPFLTKDPLVSDVNEIMTLLDKGKIVLIDISGLQSTHNLLITSILSRKIMNRRQSIYSKDREKCMKLPPIGIVLEEAERVLDKESNASGNIFTSICSEGRKFGCGLVAICQRPKNIDSDLMSQISTFFILKITDKENYDSIKSYSAQSLDKLKVEIKALQAGEAIISSPKSPFAIPVKIDLYEDYIKILKEMNREKRLKMNNMNNYDLM